MSLAIGLVSNSSNIEKELEEDKYCLFRYMNYKDSIFLHKFEILRRTPKGCWIEDTEYKMGERFILDNSLRGFAHSTREDALNAFACRKRKQLDIIAMHEKNAVLSLAKIEYVKDAIDNFNEKALQYKLTKIDELITCTES